MYRLYEKTHLHGFVSRWRITKGRVLWYATNPDWDQWLEEVQQYVAGLVIAAARAYYVDRGQTPTGQETYEFMRACGERKKIAAIVLDGTLCGIPT